MLKNNKKLILLSLVIIADIILCFLIHNNFNNINNSKEENKAIDTFFEKKENKEETITNLSNDKEENNNIETLDPYDYIAVIEIPSINLKKGLVSEESVYNNIKYNVQIIKPSQMPNVQNSNLILASHSGNSKISYFRYLYKLNKNDNVILYYENTKYTYEITNIYREAKDGTITIKKNISKNTLTLTTCDQEDKTKQIVIICELVKAEKY